jgi:transposase
VRAFLLERGVTFRQGPATLLAQLPEILENADQQLSTRIRVLLRMLGEEWKELERKIESLNNDIERICASDPACQRPQQIPGIGPLVGSALVAAIGNGAAFRRGRDLSARLGHAAQTWFLRRPDESCYTSSHTRIILSLRS